MKSDEIREHLTQELTILEAIGANNRNQVRHFHRGDMRAILHLMREREKLFDELAAVCHSLQCDKNWQQASEFQFMVRSIKAKLQEVLAGSTEVMQETMLERNRIAAKLHSIRSGRQLKNRYVRNWEVPRPGRRLNAKG